MSPGIDPPAPSGALLGSPLRKPLDLPPRDRRGRQDRPDEEDAPAAEEPAAAPPSRPSHEPGKGALVDARV